MGEELVIIQKFYDYLLWYLPHICKYPRSCRFTLGDKQEMMLLYILEKVIEAKCVRNKIGILQEMNIKIEQLRFMNRLAYDLKVLARRQYEYASRNLDEIGSMLGGWVKQHNIKG